MEVDGNDEWQPKGAAAPDSDAGGGSDSDVDDASPTIPVRGQRPPGRHNRSRKQRRRELQACGLSVCSYC